MQSSEVVARITSWARVCFLDGRPYCQSKPVRPWEGARGRYYNKAQQSTTDRSSPGKCDLRVEPIEFNETCTQPVESNSKHFWRIYFKPRNASESRYSGKIEYGTGNKIWARNTKSPLPGFELANLRSDYSSLPLPYRCPFHWLFDAHHILGSWWSLNDEWFGGACLGNKVVMKMHL